MEPYEGDCLNRPPGTVCIGYSDGYTWLVNTSIVDWDTTTCDDQQVVMAIGDDGYYYSHVLDTHCVKRSESPADQTCKGCAENIEGNTILCADYDTNDEEFKDCIGLRVTEGIMDKLEVSAKDLQIPAGLPTKLEAKVKYTDVENWLFNVSDIAEWSPNCKDVCVDGTCSEAACIDDRGNVSTFPDSDDITKKNRVKFTAKYKDKSDYIYLTVLPPDLISIEVEPLFQEVSKCNEARYAAWGTFSNGEYTLPPFDLTKLKSTIWVSSDPLVARLVKEDPGLLLSDCANPETTIGTTTITVTMDGIPDIEGTAELHVKEVLLNNIQISPHNPTLSLSSDSSGTQLTAIGWKDDNTDSPFAADDESVEWTSLDESIATVQFGLVIPKAEGEVIIRAATVNIENTTIQGSTTVTVVP